MSHYSVQAMESSGPRELGMSFLLAGLMTLIVAQRLFALPLSLGPGLSVENALLYVVLAALLFKMASSAPFVSSCASCMSVSFC